MNGCIRNGRVPLQVCRRSGVLDRKAFTRNLINRFVENKGILIINDETEKPDFSNLAIEILDMPQTLFCPSRHPPFYARKCCPVFALAGPSVQLDSHDLNHFFAELRAGRMLAHGTMPEPS